MKKLTLQIVSYCLLFVPAFSQSWTNYNTSSGLFNNETAFISSDKFNNIWVALSSGSAGHGLDKFDGTTWTHYDNTNSGLPANHVACVQADTNNVMWIGCCAGGSPGLTRFDGTNWTTYNTANSNILSNSVCDVQIDSDNNVWASCIGGLSKFDGTTFVNYPHTVTFVSWFKIQDSANVWMGGWGLSHLNPITGIWTYLTTSNSNIPSNYVTCLDITSNGIIWLGINYGFPGHVGGLATFDGLNFTPIWPFQLHHTGAYGLTIDSFDNVWVSTRCEGLYKYDGVNWSQISGVPTSGCSMNTHVDKLNNIWFAEYYTGVWTNTSTTGIGDESSTNSVSVFPNPTTNSITIGLKNSANIQILDALGKSVFEKNFTSEKNSEVRLDVSFLSSGIYFIEIDNKFSKFVKL